MLRDVQRDPTLYLVLSLYLLLLAFFILLNSISEAAETRQRAVKGSLESTFASTGRPSRLPANFTSTTGNVLGAETLQRRLGNLVSSELRLAELDILDPGRLMQLRMRQAALFAGSSAQISPAGRKIIDRLATELRLPPSDIHYRVEVRLSTGRPSEARSDVGGEGVGPGPRVLHAVRRAAVLSQALADAKLPRGSVAGGLVQGVPGQVIFRFEVRTEAETPLFGNVRGG